MLLHLSSVALLINARSPTEQQNETTQPRSTTPMGVNDVDSPVPATSDADDEGAGSEGIDDPDLMTSPRDIVEERPKRDNSSNSSSGRSNRDDHPRESTRSSRNASIASSRPRSPPASQFVFPDPMPGLSDRAAEYFAQETRLPPFGKRQDTSPASPAIESNPQLSSLSVSPVNSSDVSFTLFEAPPGWIGSVDNVATELCGSPRHKKVRNDRVLELLKDEPNCPRSPCANSCDKGKGKAKMAQSQADALRKKLNEIDARVAEIFNRKDNPATQPAPDLADERQAIESLQQQMARQDEQTALAHRRIDEVARRHRRLEGTTANEVRLLKEDVASLRDGQQRLLELIEKTERKVTEVQKLHVFNQSYESREKSRTSRPGSFRKENTDQPNETEAQLYTGRRRKKLDTQPSTPSFTRDRYPEPPHTPTTRKRPASQTETFLDNLIPKSWTWLNPGPPMSAPASNPRRRKPIIANFVPPPPICPPAVTRTSSWVQKQREAQKSPTPNTDLHTPYRAKRRSGFGSDFAESSGAASKAAKREHDDKDGDEDDSEPPLPPVHSSPAISPRTRMSPSAREIHETTTSPSHSEGPASNEALERESDDFYAGERTGNSPLMTPDWVTEHARHHPNGCDSTEDCVACQINGHGRRWW